MTETEFVKVRVITIDRRPVAYFAMPDEEFGDVAEMISSMRIVGGERLWPQGEVMRVAKPSPEQKQAWEAEGKPRLAFLVECNVTSRIA